MRKILTILFLSTLVWLPRLEAETRESMVIQTTDSKFDMNAMYQNAQLELSGDKSPKAAFFMSLLLPGLGEFYSGAKWRGLAFITFEAFTWLNYARWRSKGNDLKADFRIFADANWDELAYRSWQAFNSDPSQTQKYVETETLPSKQEDTQQYSELIGKYAQFVYGWDDVTVPFSTDNQSVLSTQRTTYEGMRNESNKFLKRASVITGLAVLNHIVSAIHAAAYTRSTQKIVSPERLWVGFSPVDSFGRPSANLQLMLSY